MKTKRFSKYLSKMGSVSDADVFDRDGNDSEISWSGESLTSGKTKNYFKVNVINNGHESIFMVEDLKKFSDLQTKITQRHPARNRDGLIITYFDKNFTEAQIKDSKDFEIFLEKYKDRTIYVSWVEENSTPVNEPEKVFVKWTIVLVTLIQIVMMVWFYASAFERGETNGEKQVDHWSGYKKIIKEFCQQHPSTEECQHMIVEFLSFKSFDSLIETRK